jgi:hypothetical protein
MNYELERIFKEVRRSLIDIILHNLREGAEEYHEKLKSV